MKRTILATLLLSSGIANAVQVSVTVPAANLPTCPTGDSGQYVVTGANVLQCIATSLTPPVVVPPPVVIPPPPPPATGFCGPNDLQVTVNWPPTGQTKLSTSNLGNQVVAFQITVPTNFNPALNITHLGFMRIVEVPGQSSVSRDITVSKQACDFQSGNYILNGIGFGNPSPQLNYTVNNPNWAAYGGSFNINSGDVVYFNLRNANNGAQSCAFPTCNVSFDFATPNRY